MIKTLALLIFSTNALALNCPEHKFEVDDYGYKTEFYCNKKELLESKEYHLKTGNLVGHKKYGEYGVIDQKSWSVEGRYTYHAVYQYISKTNYIKEVLDTKTDKLKSKEEYQLQDGEFIKTKEWVIHQASLTPQAIKHFKNDDFYPYQIDQINKEGKVLKSFKINLKEGLEFSGYVESFTSLSPTGETLGHYHESSFFDIEKVLKQRNELEFYKSKRSPVVIIDTGFDISHRDITKYLYLSPKDIPGDGIDNDNNGRVDDGHGWHMQDDAGLDLLRNDANIRETHFLTHTPYPVSHGTHVAAKAFEDTSSFGLVGFAGDVAIAEHLAGARKYIKENNVEFTNMSFAIGAPGAPMSAPSDSFYELEKLLKENPMTLFTVAAGNGRSGLDLDIAGNRNFPASYSYENMLIIGALNTANYSDKNFSNYKRASFSKYGNETVDIFAPGQRVLSAHSGGGKLELNGTSMASPFALNIILKAKEINPKLKPLQLKKIVMETAFIPTPRLKCKSGGMIYPKRVYKAAQLSLKMPLKLAIAKSF